MSSSACFQSKEGSGGRRRKERRRLWRRRDREPREAPVVYACGAKRGGENEKGGVVVYTKQRGKHVPGPGASSEARSSPERRFCNSNTHAFTHFPPTHTDTGHPSYSASGRAGGRPRPLVFKSHDHQSSRPPHPLPPSFPLLPQHAKQAKCLSSN